MKPQCHMSPRDWLGLWLLVFYAFSDCRYKTRLDQTKYRILFTAIHVSIHWHSAHIIPWFSINTFLCWIAAFACDLDPLFLFNYPWLVNSEVKWVIEKCYLAWVWPTTCIHVKSPSLGGRLPLFDLTSLLNIHLPPKSGNIPLFEPHFLPIIFFLNRVNCIEFCKINALLRQQSIHKVQ